jgi:hypothetical protein
MITASDIESLRLEYTAALGTDREALARKRLAQAVDIAKREFWAERAAIREFDGGMSRDEAEAAAWEDVK